ncbi:hypothetical protein GCM10027275_40530 [Rhabdobacter roseus]
MKVPGTFFFVAGIALFCAGCQDPQLPEPIYLKSVREARYLPTDSLIVMYQYNEEGKLLLEHRIQEGRTFKIRAIEKMEKLGWYGNGAYVLITYNEQNQPLLVKHYRSNMGWQLYESDSSIYENGRLIQLIHHDYTFQAPPTMVTGWPMWISKRYYNYGSHGRVSDIKDSVFIKHDMVGMLLVEAPPKYLYTNTTTFQYNNRGELSKKIAFTENDRRYLYTNGRWVLGVSQPADFIPGETTYAYEYAPDGRLTRQTATYTDGTDPREYVSEWTYAYNR